MLTVNRLKELFQYDPATGHFTRVVGRQGGGSAGTVAGWLDPRGYCYITIDGEGYRAHRLAFLYMTGEIPKLVDHINRKCSDNRWCNLRASNAVLNGRNRKDTAGAGVYFQEGKWRARLGLKRKLLSLGTFDTKSEALEARRTGELTHWVLP